MQTKRPLLPEINPKLKSDTIASRPFHFITNNRPTIPTFIHPPPTLPRHQSSMALSTGNRLLALLSVWFPIPARCSLGGVWASFASQNNYTECPDGGVRLPPVARHHSLEYWVGKHESLWLSRLLIRKHASGRITVYMTNEWKLHAKWSLFYFRSIWRPTAHPTLLYSRYRLYVVFVGRVYRRDQVRNIVEYPKLNPAQDRQTVELLGSEKRFLQAPQRICINQFSSWANGERSKEKFAYRV